MFIPKSGRAIWYNRKEALEFRCSGSSKGQERICLTPHGITSTWQVPEILFNVYVLYELLNESVSQSIKEIICVLLIGIGWTISPRAFLKILRVERKTPFCSISIMKG